MDDGTRQKLKLFLKAKERFVPRVYDDKTDKPVHAPVGRATIGWGFNCEDNDLPPEIADILLDHFIDIAISDMSLIFGPGTSDGWGEARQVAVASMLYNLGRSRFVKFSRMIGAIHMGNWQLAGDEATNSEWAKQVGERARETVLMMKGNSFSTR